MRTRPRLCALLFAASCAGALPATPDAPPSETPAPTESASAPVVAIDPPISSSTASTLTPTPAATRVLRPGLLDDDRFDRGGLERTSPSAIPSLVHLDALDQLVTDESTRSDALLLVADGALLGAWHFDGKDEPIETMSMTKSMLSLAVGMLIDEGKLKSLDTPVSDFFPAWKKGPKSAITLRHVLTHTTGLLTKPTTQAIYASKDFVQHALDLPLVETPGTKWAYSNDGANLLAGIIGKIAREPVDAYLTRKLFKPLGITQHPWSKDKSGNPHGMSGLALRAIDLAKIGQMIADGGVFRGARIVSQEWLATSLGASSQDLNPNVGLYWWLGLENGAVTTSYADGWLGQSLMIVPASKLIVVRQRRATKERRAAAQGETNERPLVERVRELVIQPTP